MKKITLLMLLVLMFSLESFGQRYISELNHVSFYSETPMENIEAHTYNAKSAIDLETGEIAFTIPINTFEFKKSLMQEHFNENYMESHKYPKAKFKGKLENFKKQAGKQKVIAKGILEIHGVSREVSVPGEVEFLKEQTKIKSSFPVRVADYNIKIPNLVASNIAEIVEVSIDFSYVPYEK